MATPSSKERRREPVIDSPLQIAAGLIAADRSRLPVYLAIAALPGVIEAAQPWLTENANLSFAVARVCVALGVIGYIGASWVERLRRVPTPVPLRAIGASIVAGLVIWFLFSIPPLLPLMDLGEGGRLIGLIVAVPAVIVGWRYLLLGAPPILGVRGMRPACAFARSLTRDDPLLPLRIILPPLGVRVLALTTLYGASPDGRIALVAYAAPFVASLAPILGGYLALGFILHRLSERTWSDLGLDPYRQARLTTLTVRGRPLLARILSVRVALGALGVGLLVWFGNTIRLAQMPPPAEISLAGVSVGDHRVSLTVTARDEEGFFRGFRPNAFFLASERAYPVARRPAQVTLVGDPRDIRFRLPRDRTEATIALEFSTDRTREDLQRLEDLYVWYGGNRLIKLDLKTASVIEGSGSGSGSNAPPPAPSHP